MSDEDGSKPEPFDDMKQGFLLMQEQMASMMQMMQSERVSNTEKIESLSAETAMLHAEVTANTIAEKLANRRPSLDGSPVGKSRINPLARRTSAFQKAMDKGLKTPKALLNGDVFEKMNFGGKSHENLKEHFVKFEYHARNQPREFWCDLLQLTFNKAIGDSIIALEVWC